MRECVRNADCATGNCSASRCWERNGPFVPCDPTCAESCAINLTCDPNSNYCVPQDWNADPNSCSRNADCGKDSWCDTRKKQCVTYQAIGEACNTTNLKCGKDAECFGDYCRAKCDISQGEDIGCNWVYEEGTRNEGSVADLKCRKVKQFKDFELCLPKGLFLMNEDEPKTNNTKPVADTTNTDKKIEIEASNKVYWITGGLILLILAGMIALLFFLKRRRDATKKEQKRQRDSSQRASVSILQSNTTTNSRDTGTA